MKIKIQTKDTVSGFISVKRRSTHGIGAAIIVLLLPFTSFIHLLFSKHLGQFSLLGVHLEHSFSNNQVFVWFFLMHLSSFAFVCLVFLFSRGYWRYVLFIPMYYFMAYSLWVITDRIIFSDFVLSSAGILLGLLILFPVLETDAWLRARPKRRDVFLNFETGFRELLDDWNSQWNRAIRITLAQKSTLPLKEYLYRVYYYSDLLDMHNTKVSRQQPEHRALSRGQNISRIALLLFLSMLIFVHHWIPDGQNQIEILGLEIGCFGFRDLSTFLFYASNKFVLCVLGLIWLLNTQYWWRGAILSPVLLYLYQFWEIFQPMPDLESEGNLKIMPLIALTISAVALLWALIKRISENQVYQTLLKSELDKGLRELSREKAKSRLFQMQVHNPEIL